ncbi:MAG: LacI family transcriptional regulator [Propionibacteriaceae bacterium]|jgi:LacI family transcriptional regulator|nr:LacI family transcriptional regulator [Propionibacteriaceae bacterium]
MSERLPGELPGATDGDCGVSVTIYDVAARAGVSIATVSHALNRPDLVSEPTRQRVLAVADQMEFRPRGRGGVRKASGLIKRVAVAGPFTRHPTYLQRLLGVTRAAAADYIDIITVDVQDTPDVPVLYSLPVRSRIDGLIIMGAEPSSELAESLASRRIPTVLLDQCSTSYTSVTVDDEEGGRLVAAHLLALGCRKMVFVSPPPVDNALVTSGELRLKGFANAMTEAGIVDTQWLAADGTFEGGREAAQELAEGPLPDAVFGLHDVVAAGLAAGFASRGVQVPADVRLVGYDDVDIAAMFDLTTVRQPFTQSGVLAMDALRSRINDPERPLTHVRLLPTLVVRSSTQLRPQSSPATPVTT